MQVQKIVGLTVLTVFIFNIPVFGVPVTDKEVKIKHYYSSVNGEDQSYELSYILSDGQRRKENGNFETDSNGVKKFSVYGSYKFIGSDNIPYEVNYIVDENGFQPSGDHLPGSKNFDPYIKIAIENVTCTYESDNIKEIFPANNGKKGDLIDISKYKPERPMQLFPSFQYVFYTTDTGFKLSYIVDDEQKCVIYNIGAWKPAAHVIASLVG